MFATTQKLCQFDQRSEARRLREQCGISIRRIAALLTVPPSTIYHWTRDIELTSEQRHAIRRSKAVQQAQAAGNRAMRARARQKRIAAQEHGRHLANQGDPLHVTGCMLYWAEGSKKRNDVEFTNSDPDMMRTFVRFLTRCYAVPAEKLRLTLNVHLDNGLDLSEVEHWWLARLDLPASCVGSHTVNRYSRASARTRRTLPHGTARIVLHSTFVLQSIYGAIQEYIGLERPEWLDI